MSATARPASIIREWPVDRGARTVMNRRQFGKSVVATSVAAALGSPACAAAPTIPFPLSVMLWTVARKLPFLDRLGKVAEAGYHAVELVDEFLAWDDAEFLRVNNRKRSLGIKFDAVAAVGKGIADPASIEVFQAYIRAFLTTAEKLECASVIVLSGDIMPGVSRQAQHQACVDNLKRAGDLAAKQGISLLLENIDPEENPKYYLSTVAEGFQVIREVDNPHVKFLYDFYHEQIAAGNLIEKLEKNIDLVGLVHIADVPGRHEPGTGEINYHNIFRKLAELKYPGYVAMEFEPLGDPVATLRAARDYVAQSL